MEKRLFFIVHDSKMESGENLHLEMEIKKKKGLMYLFV